MKNGEIRYLEQVIPKAVYREHVERVFELIRFINLAALIL